MAVVINGSAGVTTNSGAVYDSLQRATAVTASGTSVDFTSIPSWVRRITVMFSGVSTNGTSDYLIQIGDGSVNTSGYVAAAMVLRDTATSIKSTSTAGFIATADVNVNTRTWFGSVVLYLVSGNVWVYSGNLMGNDGLRACVSGGNKTLSAALDRVRITTVNGTDTFDAGTINIIYE